MTVYLIERIVDLSSFRNLSSILNIDFIQDPLMHLLDLFPSDDHVFLVLNRDILRTLIFRILSSIKWLRFHEFLPHLRGRCWLILVKNLICVDSSDFLNRFYSFHFVSHKFMHVLWRHDLYFHFRVFYSLLLGTVVDRHCLGSLTQAAFG